MTLLEEIDQKLHDAMKSHDQHALDTLRMLKSKIIEKRTSAGFKGEINDAIVREVAASYVKQLGRAFEEFQKAGEPGRALAERTKWEIEYLSGYLPEHLDEPATRAIVEGAIRESGATAPAQAGRVMGLVMKEHKDQVDASLVRKIVDEILSQGA